jgi:hypothetical protein
MDDLDAFESYSLPGVASVSVVYTDYIHFSWVFDRISRLDDLERRQEHNT